MFSLIKLTFAALTGLFIFVLGNGLFNTLLTIRLHLTGSSTFLIGTMMGIYYAGLACAAFNIENFIIRAGHTRTFAAFASALAIISLLHGLFINAWFWLILRFFWGFFTAGILIIIESWLLTFSTEKTRGQILSLYMVAFYAALGSGQLLINLGDPNTQVLFALTSILCSISVIPITMTKLGTPQVTELSTLNFKKLYQISAVGIVGSFCSGLILGSIYGLLPIYIFQKTTNTSAIGTFMALTIFGGVILQYPMGKLSDHLDRRKVLLWLSLSTVVISIFMLFIFNWYYLAMITTFIFGGLTFTVYPVSISHACCSLNTKDLISGTQGLLLAYSVGATIGPITAPIFIKIFGNSGLFIYFILINILLSIFFHHKRVIVAPTIKEEHFVSLPQTTPITAELDPRVPHD